MDEIESRNANNTRHDEPLGPELKAEHNDDPHSTPEDAKQPKNKKGHPQTFKQKWAVMSLPNKLNVIFSAAIFLATGAYAVFSARQFSVMQDQLVQMKAGSADTHDLAIAAGKQAAAADTQSKQAIEQTQKMAESISKTYALIRATADLGRQAKRSTDFAQDSMHLDQRAWVCLIDVQTVGGTETHDTFRVESVIVVIHNSGKTPALKISGQCCLFSSYLWSEPIPDYDSESRKSEEMRATLRKRNHEQMMAITKEHPELAATIIERDKEFEARSSAMEKSVFHAGEVLAPGVTHASGVVSKTQWGTRDERDRPKTLYILGKFTYRDIFPGTPEHTTKFCLMRSGGTTFSLCPESHWMD